MLIRGGSKGNIEKYILNGEEMSEVKDEAKTKRRTIIIFSIINFILVAGIIMFIIAIINGDGGVFYEAALGLGVISLFIMIIAGAADLIFLIIVLVRRSKRKKNTSEVIYR